LYPSFTTTSALLLCPLVYLLLSSRVAIASRAPAAISPIIVGVVILSTTVVSALVSIWVAVTGFSTVTLLSTTLSVVTVLSSVSVTVRSMGMVVVVGIVV